MFDEARLWKMNVVPVWFLIPALSMLPALAQSPVNPDMNSSSDAALKARLDAQQREIDELKQIVKQLQAEALRSANYQQHAFENAVYRPWNLRPPVLGFASAPSLEGASGNSGAAASAPDPAPQPAPAPAPAEAVASATPRELLPALGQIGAEVGFLVGGSQNPFKADNGFFSGGYIDVPVRDVPGGKLSWEIFISLQRTNTTVQTTSPVTVLVNAVANVELGTPPSLANLFGPLPVTSTVQERMTVLSVVPAELKYTFMGLDRHRIRPYGLVGLGTYVTLTTQNNTNSFNAVSVLGPGALANELNTLLQGPQIGGLVPAAPELRARGLPNGQGDARFGVQYGGGLEYRISPRLSLGFDYRRDHLEGINSGFGTFTFKQGLHF